MKLLSRWFGHASVSPSWIEPAALATRFEWNDPPLILDVRGSDKFTGRLGHIRGTNMPLIELSAQLRDLVREDRPVVVVCKTDRRSYMAAQQVPEAGLSDASVLRGGMERRRVLGLPAN